MVPFLLRPVFGTIIQDSPEEVKRMPRTKAPRADKVDMVGELGEVFRNSQAAIVTEYRGMTVSQITELRNRLRKGGGQYHVVKNTLMRRAVGDQLTPELETLLSGPTAIAFALEDPVETAKALLAYLRELRRDEFVVKGGYVGGKVYSASQVTALSKVPPRAVVLSQALGTIQAPLNNFAGTMNGILSEFARTLQAVADKRQSETA
jgi:large subunit ribosomal protein L10